MKKLDSNQDKETLQEEVERLRNENKKLASQKDKIKAKYDKTNKELKKRSSEDNIDRRTKSEFLLKELQVVRCAVRRHVEAVCKNKGFSVITSRKCKHYIITCVLGNAHSLQARAGIKLLEDFNREEALLTGNMNVNI